MQQMLELEQSIVGDQGMVPKRCQCAKTGMRDIGDVGAIAAVVELRQSNAREMRRQAGMRQGRVVSMLGGFDIEADGACRRGEPGRGGVGCLGTGKINDFDAEFGEPRRRRFVIRLRRCAEVEFRFRINLDLL